MATWRLDLADRTGLQITAGLPFRRLTARWVMNGPGALEVDCDLHAAFGATTPAVGVHELQLLRNGTKVWVGPLVEGQPDPDADDPVVKFVAEGLWSWLRVRHVRSNLVYTTTEQHAIAWGLIAHTQGQTDGGLGIVDGLANGVPISRSRAYCAAERPNIGEAIEAFTELDDGFDFEIDPATRAFNTWSPQRKTATAITLDGTKVDAMPYVSSARDMRNHVSVRQNTRCGPDVFDAVDAALRATHGLREAFLDASSGTQAESRAEGREELRATKRPRHDQTLRFRDGGTGAPAWGSASPGDTLTVADNRGWATYSRVVRLSEIAVSLDNATPTLAHVEWTVSGATD